MELDVGVSRHSIFTRKAIKQYILKPLTLMTKTHESVDLLTILLGVYQFYDVVYRTARHCSIQQHGRALAVLMSGTSLAEICPATYVRGMCNVAK